MRLLVASVIFLITSLDINFGEGNPRLHIAAMSAAILLAASVAADFLWFERPHKPKVHDAGHQIGF
jgi:hypothetical protein